MEHVDRLLKSATEDMERLLSSKSVVGEPINVNGYTVVPLLSVGFGFGAGGGTGKGKEGQGGEGYGGGTGGGGGVKPVAALIIGPDGVKIEPIQGPPSGLEKLGAAIGAALSKRSDKHGDKHQDH